MGRYVVVLLITLTIILLAALGFLFSRKLFSGTDSRLDSVKYSFFPDTFRNKVYPQGSTLTPYPGSGEVREARPERLLVISQAPDGSIKEVNLESQAQIDSLLTQGLQVELLNADPSYLLYTVGKFQAWLSIEGSVDRLIVLSDPSDSSKVYKYRVSQVDPLSPDYNYELDRLATRIDVEKLGRRGETNSIEVLAGLSQISNEDLDKMFKAGDIVIVTPVPYYPDLQAEDDNEVPFALVLTIRRKNGLEDIKRQI